MNLSDSRLTIGSRCHEDWDAMTPEQKGRFCQSCKKVVRDFTQSSPLEILKEYVSNDGKLCGRMRYDQLRIPVVPPKTRFLRRFTLALMMAFGLTLFSMDAAAIPQLESLKTSLVVVDNGDEKTTMLFRGVTKTAPTEKKKSKILPNVQIVVMIGDSAITATSDDKGQFSIALDKKLMEGHDKIHVQFDGHSDDKSDRWGYYWGHMELPINEKLLEFHEVELHYDEGVFMGIMVDPDFDN